MTKEFRKMVLASISRKAKDLTDEEILSLYKSVKEKLEGGNGEVEKTPGPEPAEQSEPSAIPSKEEEDAASDEEIESLLKDLGLDGDTDLNPVEEQPKEEDPVQEQSKEAGIEATEETCEEVPEIMVEPSETKFEDPKTEAMIEKMTERLLAQDEYSPDKFITASKGQQVCRKDKDLMADGITKPKYDEGEGIRAPREEERNPNAERYKKNNENRDPETDNDADMKISSVDWDKHLSSTPSNGGEYYGMYLPIGVEPPKVGEHLVLGGKKVVVQTVDTPEDIAKGRGGPIANKMRETGMAFHVNCLPEGHEWLKGK